VPATQILDRFFYGVDFGYRHDFYYGFSSGRMDFSVIMAFLSGWLIGFAVALPTSLTNDASDTADSEEAYFRKPVDKQTELGAVTVSQCMKDKKGEG